MAKTKFDAFKSQTNAAHTHTSACENNKNASSQERSREEVQREGGGEEGNRFVLSPLSHSI